MLQTSHLLQAVKIQQIFLRLVLKLHNVLVALVEHSPEMVLHLQTIHQQLFPNKELAAYLKAHQLQHHDYKGL
jgi:hypothetical protein